MLSTIEQRGFLNFKYHTTEEDSVIPFIPHCMHNHFLVFSLGSARGSDRLNRKARALVLPTLLSTSESD